MRISNYVLITLLALFSHSVFAAQQYMLVQCGTTIDSYAKYSDPDTGKIETLSTCTQALAKVPQSYSLVSSIYVRDGAAVNYLFSLNKSR